MRASRTSIHDRRFTCCIEILGDNRLAWATRMASVKISLPAVLGATAFLIMFSISRLIVLYILHNDKLIRPFFFFFCSVSVKLPSI